MSSALLTFLTMAPPHGAPPPLPLPPDPKAQVARESEVGFKSGDVELAATLALPPTGGPRFPAVVFVPAGAYDTVDRDAEYFSIPLFRQIAQRLAAHGIASFRYDKRGVGKSKGDLSEATLEILAGDARAAFAFIRGRPEIDPRRVGFIGHGEGCAILLAAAAPEKDLAAAILLAASSARGDEAVMENYRNRIESEPHTPEQINEALDKRKEIMEAVRSGKSLDKYGLATQKMAGHPYFKSLLAYDPKPNARKVKAPVLLVHGQKDRQVSADHGPKLKALLAKAGHRKVTLILDPGLNHLFTLARTGSPSEYGALGTKADPEIVERIADWAGRTLGTGGSRPAKPVAAGAPAAR